jgi:hypothetical protein
MGLRRGGPVRAGGRPHFQTGYASSILVTRSERERPPATGIQRLGAFMMAGEDRVGRPPRALRGRDHCSAAPSSSSGVPSSRTLVSLSTTSFSRSSCDAYVIMHKRNVSTRHVGLQDHLEEAGRCG